MARRFVKKRDGRLRSERSPRHTSVVVRDNNIQEAYRGVAAMGTIQRRKREGFIETRVSGVVSASSALDSIAELAQLVGGGSLYELVLHDDHAVLDIDYASGQLVAERGRAFLDTVRDGAIAFVAQDDVSYGRCRQLQIRLGEMRVEVEVFRRTEEARAWLDAMRAPRFD